MQSSSVLPRVMREIKINCEINPVIWGEGYIFVAVVSGACGERRAKALLGDGTRSGPHI